jgi:hypothetical protein
MHLVSDSFSFSRSKISIVALDALGSDRLRSSASLLRHLEEKHKKEVSLYVKKK